MESCNSNKQIKLLYIGCAVLCILSTLIPIWSVDILPFTDYPVHLALIQASGFSFNTPETVTEQFQTKWFTPYSTTFLLARLLSIAFSVETTGKILLMLYLVTTPLLFMRTLRLLGKPGYLAFPMFLMLYNFNLSWGFLPFLIAVPLMIETLNRSILCRINPGLTNILMACMFFTLLFFTHIFALFAALCCYLFLLLHALIQNRKIIPPMLLPVVPAVFLALLWRITLVPTESDMFFLDKGVRFAPLSLKVRFFPDYVISGDPGWNSRIIFAFMAIIVLLRFLPLARKQTKDAPAEHQKLNKTTENSVSLSTVCVGLAAVMWLLYLTSPYSWLTAVWLFNRLAFLATAFVLVLPPMQSRFPSVVYVTGITVLCVTLMWHTAVRHQAFAEESSSGLEMMTIIPPEKSLRFVSFDAGSAYTDHRPYTHFGQYYQLRHNGLVHNPFAVLSHIPVQYTPNIKTKKAGFRPEPTIVNGQLQVDLAHDRHDFYLFRLGASHTPNVIAGLFKQHMSVLPEFIGSHDQWVLFSKTESDL